MLAKTPWTPVPKARPPKLSKASSDRVIDLVIVILRRGRSSPFEYEGAFRSGIRSGLCLRGWRWSAADTAAAQIVSRALATIGAARPSWLEGQRDWVATPGWSPAER